MSNLVLFTLLFFVSCSKSSNVISETDNPDIKVEQLFEHDGCKVYRFHDDRAVYFTNCNGAAQYRVSCGKNCTRTINVD